MRPPRRREQAHSGPVARRRACSTAAERHLGQSSSLGPVREHASEEERDDTECVELGRSGRKSEELDGGGADDQDEVVSARGHWRQHTAAVGDTGHGHVSSEEGDEEGAEEMRIGMDNIRQR